MTILTDSFKVLKQAIDWMMTIDAFKALIYIFLAGSILSVAIALFKRT